MPLLVGFIFGIITLFTATLAVGQQTLTIRPPEGTVPAPTGSFIANDRSNKIVAIQYPREGIMVGMGWDSFLNRKASGTCVIGVEVTEKNHKSSRVKFSRLDDKEHLFTSLNVSASASYNAGSFSAGGKAEYAKSVRVDTQTLNVLATIALDASLQILTPSVDKGSGVRSGPILISEEALGLRRSGPSGELQFRRRCGDAFVIGIRHGGELHTLLKVRDE
jgi:hypothetical protein